MKSDPKVPDDVPLVAIGYTYISQKFLGFITMKGDRSNEPGVLCLYLYPEDYFNVSISSVFHSNMIGRYFSDCN